MAVSEKNFLEKVNSLNVKSKAKAIKSKASSPHSSIKLAHFFKSKGREPYSYIKVSGAPSIGKYKPKHTMIEKKPFEAEIRQEPSLKDVR